MQEIRRRGVEHFGSVGVPTSKHEEWRLTDTRPLARTRYALPDDDTPTVTAEDLVPFVIPGLNAHTLVFVDGRFDPTLSNSEPLPDDIVVAALADAVEHHAELVRPHLAAYAGPESEPFAALNAAYLSDGGFVYIPRGRHAESADSPAVCHDRF